MPTDQTTAPFPELAATGDTYDLCVWLTFTLNRFPAGVGGSAEPIPVATELVEERQLCIESGGTRGAWHLRVSPWSGSLTDDDVLTGPPIVALDDQRDGPDPLTLLRALLTGATA
jgi:hypothetical protein